MKASSTKFIHENRFTPVNLEAITTPEGRRYKVPSGEAYESITTAQRGLYFVWCGVIGNDLGNSKDEQHQYFDTKFLLSILNETKLDNEVDHSNTCYEG